jgi:hypothetical protein
VSKIGMNKTAGDKTVPLFVIGNGGRIKDKIVLNFLIAKGRNRNQYCYDNNDQGYCHCFLLISKNNKKRATYYLCTKPYYAGQYFNNR